MDTKKPRRDVKILRSKGPVIQFLDKDKENMEIPA